MLSWRAAAAGILCRLCRGRFLFSAGAYMLLQHLRCWRAWFAPVSASRQPVLAFSCLPGILLQRGTGVCAGETVISRCGMAEGDLQRYELAGGTFGRGVSWLSISFYRM